MNGYFSQSKKILTALAVLLLSFFAVFAQPEKLAQAHNAYNSANKLLDDQTAESFQKAFAEFQKANRLYTEVGNQIGVGKSLVGMGFATDALGKKTEALEFYQQAVPIFRRLSVTSWEANTLNNIGLIYNELGENQKALEYLMQALPLRKATGNLNGEAVTLNAIGSVYFDLGEKGKALEFYQKALQIRKSLEIENDRYNQQGQAIIFNNIGRLYDELGNHQKALLYLNQSLDLRKKIGDKKGEATTLNNIGLIYFSLNELTKSLDFYQQSLKIWNEIGNEFNQATVLNNIGTVYLERDEFQKALELFIQALEIHQKFRDRNGEAITLNNIGLTSSNLSQHQKALENFNQALIIQKQTEDKTFETITLHNLMRQWNLQKNYKLAVFYGKQAVNNYQELRRSIQNLDDETRKKYVATIEDTYRQLADILIEQGNFAQAEQVLRMLKEEEYFDFVRRDADEIASLNQRVSLNEIEQKLLERYKNLSEKVSQIGKEFSELENRKDNLTAEELKYFEELKKDLDDVNAVFELFLKKELAAEFGKAKTQGVNFDKNLQENLKKWGDGTVILYTVVSENRYRVILTTPNLQIDGKTEISVVELNKKIFAYRDALQNIETDPRPLAKELYDILIKPIEKDLQSANAKTLVWSLDGTLRYIPIATLSPDGKSYLVEKYQNVITTPNTREDFSDVDKEWRALGVGVSEKQTVENPENSEELIEFNPLPGTKDELLTIIKDEKIPNEKGIFNGRRFLDKDFTFKNFSDSLATKNADGTGKFSAVHIASHFQLGTNWANSFLLLGNGQILTLKDLKNSAAMDFSNVELITLSACDTAFTNDSNGKEVDSLASVIQAKNGKAVLAALWAVADESTPLLMSEFYRLRKENPKMSKAEAMQKVQNAFIKGELKPNDEYIKKLEDYYKTIKQNSFKFNKTAPFAHPYFWSPFVLIGNWR